VGGALFLFQIVCSPIVAALNSEWIDGPYELKRGSAENGQKAKDIQQNADELKNESLCLDEKIFKEKYNEYISSIKDVLRAISLEEYTSTEEALGTSESFSLVKDEVSDSLQHAPYIICATINLAGTVTTFSNDLGSV